MDTPSLIETARTGLLTITTRPDIVMAKGKGLTLQDTEGNTYLDFIGGWAVNALGHCPDALVQALRDQAGTLINASPSFYNRPMLAYTERLLAQT
ncbi:MAG: aminotransferase class III-fold pyridoxal phosphate-dependent enzyme, partial [Desulfobacterales bacterium]|nr:aminotransferase class III-fold pyridoxal phosphate-dependent enzyme [Desulfobacterales bacterium]